MLGRSCNFVPMMIELLCRYRGEVNPEEDEDFQLELDTQEILQGNKFDKDREVAKYLKDKGSSFQYGPFAFEVQDVAKFNRVDEEHTCLRFIQGETYVFKVKYEEYKMIHQTFTGVIINNLTDVSKIKIQNAE